MTRLALLLVAACSTTPPPAPLSNYKLGLGPELHTREGEWWRDSCDKRGLVATCEFSIFERYQLICGCVRRRQ